MFKDLEWDPSKLKIFNGPLPGETISVSEIMDKGTANEVCITQWKPLSGMGEPDDIAISILYDEISGNVFHGFSERSAGFSEIITRVSLPLNFAKLHHYLVFVRPPAEGTGESGLVSGTSYFNLGDARSSGASVEDDMDGDDIT
jgi:hypothetical protein